MDEQTIRRIIHEHNCGATLTEHVAGGGVSTWQWIAQRKTDRKRRVLGTREELTQKSEEGLRQILATKFGAVMTP